MKYLITGITGSLGQAVAKELLDGTNEVVGFSRDECKQAKLRPQDGLTLYLGDIRDRDRLIEMSRGVDLIFHFAALKHVDKLEENPEEAIRTNVVGTENVLHAQRVNHIPRVVLSSTDKAVYPINSYGMSKGISERLVLRNPNNVVCRYGNVLGSRGSVLEGLVKSLKHPDVFVNLTDSNMTRFWITIEEAAAFVIASSRAAGGLRIPIMKAAPLYLLASAVASTLGVLSYETRQVGSRAGEKMHECLRTQYEGEEIYSHNAPQFTEAQLAHMIRPIVAQIL